MSSRNLILEKLKGKTFKLSDIDESIQVAALAEARIVVQNLNTYGRSEEQMLVHTATGLLVEFVIADALDAKHNDPMKSKDFHYDLILEDGAHVEIKTAYEFKGTSSKPLKMLHRNIKYAIEHKKDIDFMISTVILNKEIIPHVLTYPKRDKNWRFEPTGAMVGNEPVVACSTNIRHDILNNRSEF